MGPFITDKNSEPTNRHKLNKVPDYDDIGLIIPEL
jgi:hypothetical protein